MVLYNINNAAVITMLTCVDSMQMQQKSLGWLRWQADGSVRM